MKFTLALLAVSTLVLPGAMAGHCTTWSTSTTSPGHIIIEVPASIGFPQYLAIDTCQPDCLFSVWVYPEANGIPGLQRGDEVVDDTCHGMIDADVLLGL